MIEVLKGNFHLLKVKFTVSLNDLQHGFNTRSGERTTNQQEASNPAFDRVKTVPVGDKIYVQKK